MDRHGSGDSGRNDASYASMRSQIIRRDGAALIDMNWSAHGKHDSHDRLDRHAGHDIDKATRDSMDLLDTEDTNDTKDSTDTIDTLANAIVTVYIHACVT
ncbi:unnamed protein product [Phytophthora fragariaefolia]|uniref:Unnamed protein product n=1 Tax=Phytophthora fragariaefolia TaxID=1490495 RepID=A0A9W6Y9A9_9STRA|nr:unnamed protein product [Phytophthora fragariaefolia]